MQRVTSRSERSSTAPADSDRNLNLFWLICLQNPQDSHFNSYILFIEQLPTGLTLGIPDTWCKNFFIFFSFTSVGFQSFFTCPLRFFLRSHLSITRFPAQHPHKPNANFRKEVLILTKIMTFSVTVVSINAESDDWWWLSFLKAFSFKKQTWSSSSQFLKCSLVCSVFLGKSKVWYIYTPGLITCHFQYLTEPCGCPRLLVFSAVKNVDICLGFFIWS